MRRGGATVALVALLVACQAAAPPSSVPARGSDPARGSAPADTTTTPSARARTAPGALVDFTLRLRLPGAGDRERLLADVHDPASPSFGTHLTPDEQGARFGLPVATIDRLVGWLDANGVETLTRYRNRSALEVRAAASTVEALFGVRLFDDRDEQGRRFHAPDAAPAIPPALAADVVAVDGLDDQPRIRPFVRLPTAFVPDGGMRPADARRAYEVEALYDAGIRGQGQAIAIVSFDTFDPLDIVAFDDVTGTTGRDIERIRLPWPADTDDPVSNAEVALDLQIIRGIAPEATILDYEAPNGRGFAPVIRRIVDDGRATIVSISWGACEDYIGGGAEEAFADATLAGITLFAASGDDGSYDCWRNAATEEDPLARDPQLDVDYPSSSPNVVSVGGTYLWLRTDGTWDAEAAWQDTFSAAAGGGGISERWVRPSWQTGPGVDNERSNGRRQVPDVAGPADCQSAFFIVFTPPGFQQWAGPGGCGTSAAAPFWAASMALARQLIDPVGTEVVRPLGPVLYALAADDDAGALFHDITLGGNLGYKAGPGWDFATGWGSPRVAPLAQAIADYVREHPTAE